MPLLAPAAVHSAPCSPWALRHTSAPHPPILSRALPPGLFAAQTPLHSLRPVNASPLGRESSPPKLPATPTRREAPNRAHSPPSPPPPLSALPGPQWQTPPSGLPKSRHP